MPLANVKLTTDVFFASLRRGPNLLVILSHPDHLTELGAGIDYWKGCLPARRGRRRVIGLEIHHGARYFPGRDGDYYRGIVVYEGLHSGAECLLVESFRDLPIIGEPRRHDLRVSRERGHNRA